jgi:NAD(P)-dependent dehydrogenase (short-subunit alcohol dehydrogenase family)
MTTVRSCHNTVLSAAPLIASVNGAALRRVNIAERAVGVVQLHPCNEQFNDLAPLSPFRSWLDCITHTFGYDFRKGQEVAATVCFLAGPGAASITGQTLALDGGLTAN